MSSRFKKKYKLKTYISGPYFLSYATQWRTFLTTVYTFHNSLSHFSSCAIRTLYESEYNDYQQGRNLFQEFNYLNTCVKDFFQIKLFSLAEKIKVKLYVLNHLFLSSFEWYHFLEINDSTEKRNKWELF